MSTERPFRAEMAALVRLALPLAVAQGGQALMGIVDAAVCGRAGSLALAGVGLGNSLAMFLAVFGLGLMQGLDPLVAQAVGAGQAVRARHLYWQGLWLAGLVGLALTLPFVVVPFFLVPLGIEPALAREASAFFLLRLPGLPAFFAFFAARAYLQGLGTGRPQLLATLVGNAVNLPLDLVLVFGGADLPAWTGPLRSIPPLGAAGAAIATTVGTFAQLGVLALAVRAVRMPAGTVLSRGFDRAAVRTAFRVGWPVGLHFGAEVGIFALVGFFAARLGQVPLAAHQLAIALASFTFTFIVGFGAAGSVRVGWAVGAGDRLAARRSGLAALASGALFMAGSALVFLLLPGTLARLMTSDAEVIATAEPLLLVTAVFQIFDGLQGVGAGVLRGAGETRFTLWANVIGHWVLAFPATLLLGFGLGLGVTGLWWGFVLGLGTVAVLLVGRFLSISSREIVPLAARLR